MFKFFAALLLLFSFSLMCKANDIEIRYRMPGVKEVYLIWGVNNWTPISPLPAGTVLKDKVMHSVMKKEGDEFVFTVSIPAGSVVYYGFYFTKAEGFLNMNIGYWDCNNQPEKLFYHTYSNNSEVVKITPSLNYVKPAGNILPLYFAGFVCLLFYLIGFVVFVFRKYYLKVSVKPLNAQALLFSASFSLLCILFIIRAEISDMVVPFLIKPFATIPSLLKITYDDFLYSGLLFLIFGLLFFVRKKSKSYVLSFYLIFIFISIVLAIVNAKVIEVLGKPFNYQWLYYSDFLKSTDASKAVGANLGSDFLIRGLLIILAIIPLCYTLYHLHIKQSFVIPAAIIITLLIGFFSNSTPYVSRLKMVNPVFYFVGSLYGTGGFLSTDKNLAKESEFMVKNTDSLPANYHTIFKKSKIKNVLIFVLESTPAEYITAYNPSFKATPFLDSFKSHAVMFDAIYAHAPATNKSMVSILCASYPYLSYLSITDKYSAFKMPSISSELKKYGYRSAFINSGDNRFQNAGEFLKNREIEEIQDYRNNPCATTVFTPTNNDTKNLEGVDDSCLSVKFLNWIKKDTSKPFFTMMWTFQTHYPYFFSGKPTDYGIANPLLQKYLNALHRADETLRDVVEGLKKENLLESTLIVVLGDHGEAFGRHDQLTHAAGIYEENLHVPMMFINPTLFNGERLGCIGGISDVAPSIFSILNKPAPEAWQGENLFSVNRRKRVYFFSPYSDYLFGFREGNYKFIFNATDNSSFLFDLKKDPLEANNIAGKEPEYVKQANKHLQSWIQYQNNYMNKVLGISDK
jgi:arylsulfatase A-like enzyme